MDKQTITVTVLLLGTASQCAEKWINGLFMYLPQLDWWGQSGMHLQRVCDWQSGALLFNRGRFTKQAKLTYATQWPFISANAEVDFVTPLVSKHQHDDPLAAALKTRIQRLRKQFGDAGCFARDEDWHCQILAKDAIQVSLGENGRKVAGKSYRLKLTGINLQGAALLGAGLWLHAGGQTGLGMGRYRLTIGY